MNMIHSVATEPLERVGVLVAKKDVVLDVPGLVHLPERAEPTRRLVFRTDPGELFAVLVLEMDLVPGRWGSRNSDDAHLIFLVERRDGPQSSVLGSCEVFPPSRGFPEHFYVAHDAGASEDEGCFSHVQSVPLCPDLAYNLRYVYDTASPSTELRITTGEEKRTILAKPPAPGAIETGSTLEVVLGHEPAEHRRATWGWRYSNLKLSLLRASAGEEG